MRVVLMISKWKILGINIVSLIILGCLLWFSDIAQLWDLILIVPWYFYFAFLLFYGISFIIRADIWKRIFSRLGYSIPLSHLYYATGVAWLVNQIIPGRMGELARIEIVTKSQKVEYGTSIISIALVRLFDLIVMVALILMGLLFLNYTILRSSDFSSIPYSNEIQLGIFIGISLICVLLITFFVLLQYPQLILKIVSKISTKLGNWMEKLLEPITDGLNRFRTNHHRTTFILIIGCETLVTWIIDCGIIVILCNTLNLDIHPFVPFLGLLITFLLHIIPTTPGNWGVSEFVWAGFISVFYPLLSLQFLVSLYLIEHLLRYVYAICFGVISLPRTNYKFRISKETNPEIEEIDLKNSELPQ